MNSLKILRATIRLLVNKTVNEGGLDASWSMSPLATARPEEEDEEMSESEEDIKEFVGGNNRLCGY